MRTLILIDNNKDTFQFIKEACGALNPGIHCISFVYAQEAVKTLMTGLLKKPDAVFINLSMTGMNGIQCLMELRSNPTLTGLPINSLCSKDYGRSGGGIKRLKDDNCF